jgi:hypothetical protein
MAGSALAPGVAILAVIASVALCDAGFATEGVPLPRPRPSSTIPQPAAQVGGGGVSACARRMAAVAVVDLLPPITGPGACVAEDVLRLMSIRSPDGKPIKIEPPVILRCAMAETLGHWVRDAYETLLQEAHGTLTAITTATSFQCRGRNRDRDTKISQHGIANAVDVIALVVNGGRALMLSDSSTSLHVRERLHAAACKRFTTVLGPGSDGYHEDHIHLDIASRQSGYRICQWELR